LPLELDDLRKRIAASKRPQSDIETKAALSYFERALKQ